MEKSGHSSAHVFGVIVTYHPNAEALGQLLAAISPQVQRLVVVDNGSAGFDFDAMCRFAAFELVSLGDNYGIAHAQNVGIDKARQNDASHVLLLDQDSIPTLDMVDQLLAALTRLELEDLSVAGVGPSYLDQRQGEAAPFVYLDGFSLKRRTLQAPGQSIVGKPLDGIVEADFLIASGCLIPIDSLEAVGPMIDGLFIDYVDIEWGLRARQKGYRSYGVFAARMAHSLGDEWTSFRGRRIPIHSPLRHYYHIRNALWLLWRSWLPWRWRVVIIWRIVRQLLFFTFLAPQGRQHGAMMALGLWHGLVGRMGRK